MTGGGGNAGWAMGGDCPVGGGVVGGRGRELSTIDGEVVDGSYVYRDVV